MVEKKKQKCAITFFILWDKKQYSTSSQMENALESELT